MWCQIAIQNNKGRLSQEEIAKMIADAEKYKAEDERIKSRIEARNMYENYLYGLKDTYENAETKLSDTDKTSLKSMVETELDWIRDNSSADKEEIDGRRKEVESKANPIVMSMYNSTGDSESTTTGSATTSGPKVEEVD
jgi:L1 cell adhesion molecule like protein